MPNPTVEMEHRAGVEPLDELLAERAKLVGEVADLRARYGPGGTYGDLRRVELARIAAIVRAQAVKDSRKISESAIDDEAHADPRYVRFVTEATEHRAEWSILEDRVQSVQDRIFRGQALLRFASQEIGLQR